MHLLLLALSTVCACLPMMVFLAVVWWLDRYDREPLGVVAGAFAYGAVGAVFLAMLGSVLLAAGAAPIAIALAEFAEVDPDLVHSSMSAVVFAPLAEEPAKALILLPIAFSRHFDNMTDGFVYGAASGLGFGMTENLLYFVSVSGDPYQWLGTVFVRTFYSAVMHATATATVGAGLGWGRFRGIRPTVLMGSLGLTAAIGIHATWNGLLTIDQVLPDSPAWQADLTLLPLLVFGVFVVFELCVLEETRTIRRELEDEVERGVLPPTHPRILASWWRRMGHHWAPANIDKRSYIAAATSLALRKHQARLLGQRAPGWYAQDIALLRRKLKRMLGRG